MNGHESSQGQRSGREVGGTYNWCGRNGNEKYVSPPPKIEIQFFGLQFVAQSLYWQIYRGCCSNASLPLLPFLLTSVFLSYPSEYYGYHEWLQPVPDWDYIGSLSSTVRRVTNTCRKDGPVWLLIRSFAGIYEMSLTFDSIIQWCLLGCDAV
jgi:hypothetical protein